MLLFNTVNVQPTASMKYQTTAQSRVMADRVILWDSGRRGTSALNKQTRCEWKFSINSVRVTQVMYDITTLVYRLNVRLKRFLDRF